MEKRLEYKYLVPFEKLPELREMLSPFVVRDKYAARRPNGEYTVRSIYFDTPTLQQYYEKIEGLQMRRKLRIRGYNTQEPDSMVFLEIKRRYGSPIAKNRSPLPYADLEMLMRTRDLDGLIKPSEKFPRALDDAKRFFFHMCRGGFVPVVTVVYDREPYVGKFDESIRVTFDKNLRSEIFPTLDRLYSNSRLVRTFDKHFILEIKFFGSLMPIWGRSIVRRLQLKQKALSKYTLSVDSHQSVLTRSRNTARGQRILPALREEVLSDSKSRESMIPNTPEYHVV